MQIINTWPNKSKPIALPDTTKLVLLKHLQEPFQGETEAKAYWQDNQTILIILDQDDTKESFLQLDDLLHHQIEMALKNPEYTEELGNDYVIKLAIISDAGNGIYCVLPKMLDLILTAQGQNKTGLGKTHD